MIRKLSATIAILAIHSSLFAQWNGPTSNLLSTNNSIQINNQYLLGTQGSPPPPALLEIISYGAATIKIMSVEHERVIYNKPLILN